MLCSLECWSIVTESALCVPYRVIECKSSWKIASDTFSDSQCVVAVSYARMVLSYSVCDYWARLWLFGWCFLAWMTKNKTKFSGLQKSQKKTIILRNLKMMYTRFYFQTWHNWQPFLWHCDWKTANKRISLKEKQIHTEQWCFVFTRYDMLIKIYPSDHKGEQR